MLLYVYKKTEGELMAGRPDGKKRGKEGNAGEQVIGLSMRHKGEHV